MPPASSSTVTDAPETRSRTVLPGSECCMAFVMGIKSASSSSAGSATTHADWPSRVTSSPALSAKGFAISAAAWTTRDRIIAFGHQELRREGDRGEWSAQLVGRAGQKPLLSLLESAPLREVLGHDQHSVLATVTQVRHVLKFDTQEGLSSPHAGFSALPLLCAARDRLAQVEVLPGAGELSVLLAHAEHGPPRRVGEDHRAPRVGRDHALGEVIQDGAESRILLGQPAEGFLQVGSHGVEGLGEGAKLVSETGFDAVRQMAALHQTGARTQALDPPREHHGQQEHQAAADEGGENRRL